MLLHSLKRFWEACHFREVPGFPEVPHVLPYTSSRGENSSPASHFQGSGLFGQDGRAVGIQDKVGAGRIAA